MFRRSQRIPLASGILACLLLTAACEKMLPTELREKTGYAVSGVDATAVGLMAADTTGTAPDGMDAAVLPRPALDSWIAADDAFILANLDTVETDKAFLIRNPQLEDTVFAFMPARSGPSAETVFYLSWELSPANLDATVDLAVFDAAGGAVLPSSSAMSPELMAACTRKVETGGLPAAVPKIRGRYAYAFNPAQGRFLIRFVLSKPQAIGPLQVAVLHGNGSGL